MTPPKSKSWLYCNSDLSLSLALASSTAASTKTYVRETASVVWEIYIHLFYTAGEPLADLKGHHACGMIDSVRFVFLLLAKSARNFCFDKIFSSVNSWRRSLWPALKATDAVALRGKSLFSWLLLLLPLAKSARSERHRLFCSTLRLCDVHILINFARPFLALLLALNSALKMKKIVRTHARFPGTDTMWHLLSYIDRIC